MLARMLPGLPKRAVAPLLRFHPVTPSPRQAGVRPSNRGGQKAPSTGTGRLGAVCLAAALSVGALDCSGQTVFLDFNTAGQYPTNFNPWNDSSGANGGNYSFAESPAAGVGGGGGVSVFQSADTTAVYRGDPWDFSTNGAAILLSVLLKANGQTSGDKIQFGLLNSNTNGLNNNAGVAFESFRFVPASATNWSLREQFRTANTNATETTLGTVPIVAGHWYKFVIGFTNTGAATGNLSAGCALYDYGADGQTPGANLVTFPTVESRTGQDIVRTAAAFPALRAFQDAGVDAWDNLLACTPQSPWNMSRQHAVMPVGAP